MKSADYFALFGDISDKYVTEAIIPLPIPTPIPKRGIRKASIGGFLSGPAFIAVVGAVIAAAVAIGICISLVGGDGSADGKGTEYDSGYATGEHTHIHMKDYGNTLEIYYYSEIAGENLAYLPDESVYAEAAALNADLHERIRKTEAYLGINIELVDKVAETGITDSIRHIAQSGDTRCHLVLGSSYVVASLGNSDGIMTPWETAPAVRLDEDYWDAALTETYTQGGHGYVACNRFVQPNACAIAYNKDLYARCEIQRDLYALVESGDWTLETMMAVLTETESKKTHGLVVSDVYASSAYLAAADFSIMQIVETDEGYTVEARDPTKNEEPLALYAGVLELTTHPRRVQSSTAKTLESGKLLMDTRRTRVLASKDYGISMGILPLPKYDKAQSGYRSVHTGAYLGLFTQADTAQMCGEAAELLAFFSKDSYEDYNRAVLGVYGRDDSGVQKDLEMLRMIHDTDHELGLTHFTMLAFFSNSLVSQPVSDLKQKADMVEYYLNVIREDYGW